MDDKINDIISFFKNLVNPDNITITTSVIGVGVPVIMYLLKLRTIPKLAFDGVYRQNIHYGIDYFVKVKREEGEAEAEGVKGFVGIEDKIELNPSGWIKGNTETDIAIYDYLSLFKTFKHKEYEIINFHTKENLPPPDENNLYENNRYSQFKDDELIVKIVAARARIKEKQIKKKIEDIVNEAKPIPM